MNNIPKILEPAKNNLKFFTERREWQTGRKLFLYNLPTSLIVHAEQSLVSIRWLNLTE